jgi:hypothetical protein
LRRTNGFSEALAEQEIGFRKVRRNLENAMIEDFENSGQAVKIPTGEDLRPSNGFRRCFILLLALAGVGTALFLVSVRRYDHDLYSPFQF